MNDSLAQVFQYNNPNVSSSDKFYDDLSKSNINDSTPNYMQQGNLLGTILKIPSYPILSLMSRFSGGANENTNPAQQIIDSPNWWLQGGPRPPQNEHLLKFEELNQERAKTGLPPMDRNEYVTNYLPEGYGFPPSYITNLRPLNTDEQNWLDTNPYLEGFSYTGSNTGINLPAFGGRTLDPRSFQPYNFDKSIQVTEGPTTIR